MSLVDGCVLKIVDDMMSSNLLPANYKESHVCYIRDDKIKISNIKVLRSIVSLGMDAPVVNSLSNNPLDDRDFYISTEKDIIHRIQVADSFVKNDHKLAFFRTSAFYRVESALFNELHILHLGQGEKKLPAFALFFKRGSSKKVTDTVIALFITTMSPFNYDARDKS